MKTSSLGNAVDNRLGNAQPSLTETQLFYVAATSRDYSHYRRQKVETVLHKVRLLQTQFHCARCEINMLSKADVYILITVLPKSPDAIWYETI